MLLLPCTWSFGSIMECLKRKRVVLEKILVKACQCFAFNMTKLATIIHDLRVHVPVYEVSKLLLG